MEAVKSDRTSVFEGSLGHSYQKPYITVQISKIWANMINIFIQPKKVFTLMLSSWIIYQKSHCGFRNNRNVHTKEKHKWACQGLHSTCKKLTRNIVDPGEATTNSRIKSLLCFLWVLFWFRDPLGISGGYTIEKFALKRLESCAYYFKTSWRNKNYVSCFRSVDW